MRQLILTPFSSHGGALVFMPTFDVRMWQSWLKYISVINVFIVHQVLKNNHQNSLNHIYNLCRLVRLTFYEEPPKTKTDSRVVLVGLCSPFLCCWISLTFEGNAVNPRCEKDHLICSQTQLGTSPFHLQPRCLAFSFYIMLNYFVDSRSGNLNMKQLFVVLILLTSWFVSHNSLSCQNYIILNS